MIIISGASRGIGSAIFEDLKEKKIDVLGISRTGDSKKGIIECDISDFSSVKSVASKIKKEHKNIYALINVAGIASMNLALATPEKTTRNIISTNLIGTIFTNQLFAPLIIRSKKPGRIINFSTLAIKLGIKGEAVYIASKAAVEAYSRSLARELSGFNITVNCIAPGPIKTDLLRGVSEKQIDNIVSQQIFPRVCEVKDVVNQVNMLLSEQANLVSGQTIHVGGA
tara:strand:+ start:10165 stop:10842 length:678 start_codon:yes stop_codon:yes gene_type:complete